MNRIIAVSNQKGGVGKTTTAINLSACLAEKGQRVLVIDIDPQGNTTSGFGIDKYNTENTVYELMVGECLLEECMIENIYEKLSIIPSNVNLAGAEIELIDIDEKEYILKKEIDKVKDKFDYVIIDCPPSLNILTVNAMTTANTILVPIQCEYYALEGLSQLIHTINLVKERLNPELEIEGVVFTMYDARTNLSLQVVENVKEGNYITNVVYCEDPHPFLHNRVAELKAILEGVDEDFLKWEITEADIGVDSGQCGIYDYESVKDIIGTGEYDEKDTFYGQACQCTDVDEQYKELNGYGVVSRSGVGDGSYDLYIAKQDDQVVGFRVVYLNEDEDI